MIGCIWQDWPIIQRCSLKHVVLTQTLPAHSYGQNLYSYGSMQSVRPAHPLSAGPTQTGIPSRLRTLTPCNIHSFIYLFIYLMDLYPAFLHEADQGGKHLVTCLRVDNPVQRADRGLGRVELDIPGGWKEERYIWKVYQVAPELMQISKKVFFTQFSIRF